MPRNHAHSLNIVQHLFMATVVFDFPRDVYRVKIDETKADL